MPHRLRRTKQCRRYLTDPISKHRFALTSDVSERVRFCLLKAILKLDDMRRLLASLSPSPGRVSPIVADELVLRRPLACSMATWRTSWVQASCPADESPA
jgi:hypothetical protein